RRVVLDYRQRSGDRGVIITGAQIGHLDDVPAVVRDKALTPCRGVVNLGHPGGAGLGSVAAVGKQQACASAIDAVYRGTADRGDHLVHLRQVRVSVVESAEQAGGDREEAERNRQDGEGTQRARGAHPALAYVLERLVVPEAVGGARTQLEVPETGR